MLIVCPTCATSYDVEVASLRPNGRRVRCVRCRAVWDAEIPRAEKLLAAAEALAPSALAPASMAPPSSAPPPLTPEPVAPPRAVAAAPAPAMAAEPGPERETRVEQPRSQPAVADFAATVPVVMEAPPTVPTDLDGSVAAAGETVEGEPAVPAVEDIETLAARRYPQEDKRRTWYRPLSKLQTAILVLVVVNAIVVGWRSDFVRAMPQTASFYAWIGLPVNLRGLKFGNLTTETEQHEGLPILVVEGDVVNLTGKSKDVPHLRFAIRNAAHQEIYSWTAAPPRTILPPGETAAFHTRLASPPPDAHDVLVRFVNRYDITTGAH